MSDLTHWPKPDYVGSLAITRKGNICGAPSGFQSRVSEMITCPDCRVYLGLRDDRTSLGLVISGSVYDEQRRQSRRRAGA